MHLHGQGAAFYHKVLTIGPLSLWEKWKDFKDWEEYDGPEESASFWKDDSGVGFEFFF